MPVGTYYNIVNVAKRQFLGPEQFGEPFTWSCVLDGHHAVAISLLVCNCGSLGFGPPAGSWHGDAIYLVGDSGPPNQFGIPTVTAQQPDRNLYAMASFEFEDISLRALVMLFAWRKGAADALAKKCAGNPCEGPILLRNLGDILHSELRDEIEVDGHRNAEVLEHALTRHFGPDWKRKYRSLVAERKPGIEV
jgi:hypothetical protein